MTKSRPVSTLTEWPVKPPAVRKVSSARERLEAFDAAVRSFERILKSAQQGPCYLGDLGMPFPLYLLGSRHLARDALLGFQHTSTCHFQGFVNCHQPPCVAEWRRGQPLAFTRRTRLRRSACRRRSAARICPMWVHRRSAYVRIVPARQPSPSGDVRLPCRWGSGIDLDQWRWDPKRPCARRR